MGKRAASIPDRAALMKKVRCVVVKLGTRVVTVRDNQLNRKLIDRLAEDVAGLLARKVRVAIVSSGAVGAGMGRLGLKARPRRLGELQATAAVGQGLLMNAYKLAFREHNVPVGQVLLTSEDLDNRARYVHAQGTLDALFRYGAVPIINENDSVAVDELHLSVGDNDRLSAMVAHLVDAELLVTFTDVEGLYSDNPAEHPEANLIREVHEVTPEILALAGKAGSEVGRGGMRTKVMAAESVTRGGRMMLIADGHQTRVREVMEGAEVGTFFRAKEKRLPGRKLWIANSRKHGAVVVDAGAARAIGSMGKSLLPSGIVAVTGSFEAGDLIAVEDEERKAIAHGVARYAAEQVRKILGRKTSEISRILSTDAGEEVVHRDDLVVL
jgi:glutamate 5-kinase